MIPAWLSFFDAILAVVLAVTGILGANFGYLPPFMGFQLFAFGFLLSIVGLLAGIVGIVATRSPQRTQARPRAVFGTVISLAVALPVLFEVVASNKTAINDITTDFDHPPEFAHATDLLPNHGRDMKYDKQKYAARQAGGYGELAPLKMASQPDAAFTKAEVEARQMPNWEITAEDPKARSLEGVETSRLFHFQDDFVIQVRPSNDSSGSLVEMRSKSRDGIGDFGVNYRRIRTFFAKLGTDARG